MQKNKTYDECKLQGNQAVHLGNYDEALKRYVVLLMRRFLEPDSEQHLATTML